MLTSKDKGWQRPECSELDALKSGQVDLRSVTEVTLLFGILTAFASCSESPEEVEDVATREIRPRGDA